MKGHLTGRLAGFAFPFSQATIWKIESGQRPLKAAEMVAIADALEIHGARRLFVDGSCQLSTSS